MSREEEFENWSETSSDMEVDILDSLDSDDSDGEEEEDEEEVFTDNTSDNSSESAVQDANSQESRENSVDSEVLNSHEDTSSSSNSQPMNDVEHVSVENDYSEPMPENQQATSSQKKSPVQKMNDSQSLEDQAFSCSICLDGLTNSGPHKPACLKCGHIFGVSCLRRWIKVGCNSDSRRCPTCNTKATEKDIRVLYAKKLIAIDTSELTALEKKLEKENCEKNILKSEIEMWKVKATYLTNEVNKLKSILNTPDCDKPSTSYGPPTSVRQCLKRISLSNKKGCRVMAYNKTNTLLLVSQHSEITLFKSYVVRKLNALTLEPTRECIHAHKKQIRDMAFNPAEQNLLATVSLDKSSNLIDLTTNSIVSSLELPEPLWSCCWAGDNPNMLVVGGQMGSLFYADRRYMKLLDAQIEQKPACVSLVPIPPSNSRAFMRGGFIKTRLDYLSMFETFIERDITIYKETELPLLGLWSSSYYDTQSNLVLSSSKPCGFSSSMRHIVCKISDHNKTPILKQVAIFKAGNKATQLSRSCIVPNIESNEDTLVCCYDEKSTQIKLFGVDSGTNVHNFKVKENILDLCYLGGVVINGRRTVAGLSDTALSLFTV